MSQEQTFQLILALVQQGHTSPKEIAKIIKIISDKVF